MPIIYFFGPDGAGKTTLARKTALALAKKGFSVRVSWMRGTHSFSYVFARLLRFHRAFRGRNHSMVSVPENLKLPWRFVEFTSALPVLMYRFVLPNLFGVWVVGERFIPDFLVWVSIVLDDKSYMESFEARLLSSMTKKAKASFYITANPEELTVRSMESYEFLSNQQELYEMLSKKLGAFKVDTTNLNIEESFQLVYHRIGQSDLKNQIVS